MDRLDAGAGFAFVVREIIDGPRDLEEAVPARAVTRSCLAGPDGGREFWCAQLEQPVKHRIGQAPDPHRYHGDYLDRDELGPFFWTYYIAIQARESVPVGPGSRGVVVDLAYVIDPSLGYDTTFDSTKVDWVATATVDGADTEVITEPQPQPQPHPERDPDPQSYTPTSHVHAELPLPRGELADKGTEVTVDQFGHAIDSALTTLADLTGTPSTDVARPQEVKARKHSPNRFRDKGPAYSFHGNELRYSTVDPIRGPVWNSTTDPEEALYWIVNDAAHSMAWTWAHRAPASRTMSARQVQWLLAMPMWLALVTALDTALDNLTAAEPPQPYAAHPPPAFPSQ
jgi:hypothetical protein